VREARERSGREAQIGVTCHASRHLAMEAGEAGADYVAFGAFYPSETKASEHRPARAARLVAGLMEIPCVAIGGITPRQLRPLIEAGPISSRQPRGVGRRRSRSGAALSPGCCKQGANRGDGGSSSKKRRNHGPPVCKNQRFV
jgi:hypothetical protein